MTTTFWSTQNLTPPVRVATETIGDRQVEPYEKLPGGEEGIDPPEVQQGRDAVFPLYNGSTVTIRVKPPGFATAPDSLSSTEFQKWHSALQAEYINGRVAAGVALGIDQGDNRITVMVSPTDPVKVYVLSALQKRDFAKMPLADQQAIAATDYFRNTLAPRYGLSPSGSLSATEAKAAAEQIASTLRNKILTDPTFGSLFTTTDGGATWSRAAGISENSQIKLLKAKDIELFLKQLDNITARIQTSAIFSPADIDTAAKEIEKRWNRVKAFGNVDEATIYLGLGRGLLSLDLNDNLGQIRSGLTNFLAQEKRLLELDQARLDYARAGALGQKSLDVPTLVFLFQLNYNLTVEAKVTADAEEVTQFNNLLKIYSAMQGVVNRTSAEFDPSDNDQEKGVLGKSGDDTAGSISGEDLRTIAIFEDALGTQDHPLEVLYGIDRPTFDMIYNGSKDGKDNRFNVKYKTAWDSFGTQLSDKVTLINQESQIKTNDINSLDKQKNRHFDLANGALSKLSDMIQSIGRNVA